MTTISNIIFWLLPDIFFLYLSTKFPSITYSRAVAAPTFSPIPSTNSRRISWPITATGDIITLLKQIYIFFELVTELLLGYQMNCSLAQLRTRKQRKVKVRKGFRMVAFIIVLGCCWVIGNDASRNSPRTDIILKMEQAKRLRNESFPYVYTFL